MVYSKEKKNVHSTQELSDDFNVCKTRKLATTVLKKSGRCDKNVKQNRFQCGAHAHTVFLSFSSTDATKHHKNSLLFEFLLAWTNRTICANYRKYCSIQSIKHPRLCPTHYALIGCNEMHGIVLLTVSIYKSWYGASIRCKL